MGTIKKLYWFFFINTLIIFGPSSIYKIMHDLQYVYLSAHLVFEEVPGLLVGQLNRHLLLAAQGLVLGQSDGWRPLTIAHFTSTAKQFVLLDDVNNENKCSYRSLEV